MTVKEQLDQVTAQAAELAQTAKSEKEQVDAYISRNDDNITRLNNEIQTLKDNQVDVGTLEVISKSLTEDSDAVKNIFTPVDEKTPVE